MKTLTLLFCLLTPVSWLLASNLALTDGRVLRDATILSQSATTVTVRHAGGLASVPKAQLPEALRAQYPVASQEPGVRSQESGEQKAARLAKLKADEQARIAKAKARQAERAQWLKDNPQEHEVIYRVESTSPSISIISATPEKGIQTFYPKFENGVYEDKFTAKDGFKLLLGMPVFGTDSRTGKYASTITLSILVDGSVVRREALEPRSGSLDMAWVLGSIEQAEVSRSQSAEVSNGEVQTGTGQNTVRTISQTPGFISQ